MKNKLFVCFIQQQNSNYFSSRPRLSLPKKYNIIEWVNLGLIYFQPFFSIQYCVCCPIWFSVTCLAKWVMYQSHLEVPSLIPDGGPIFLLVSNQESFRMAFKLLDHVWANSLCLAHHWKFLVSFLKKSWGYSLLAFQVHTKK